MDVATPPGKRRLLLSEIDSGIYTNATRLSAVRQADTMPGGAAGKG
jgi:hypothetical protein